MKHKKEGQVQKRITLSGARSAHCTRLLQQHGRLTVICCHAYLQPNHGDARQYSVTIATQLLHWVLTSGTTKQLQKAVQVGCTSACYDCECCIAVPHRQGE